MHQSELYKLTKDQAEREKFLREIIEKMRSSLDINQTLDFICREVTKLFNVQRIAITTFPNRNDFSEFIIKSEYKVSPEIRGIGFIPDFGQVAAFWGENLISKAQIVAIDCIENSNLPQLLKNIYSEMGLKSIIGAAIRSRKDVWGILILSEYNNCRHWTEDEKILLKTIANQIYITLTQAELFEQEKISIEREKLIGKIFSKALSTFDIDEIKHVVTDIGKMLKADRCYFVEVDYENMKGKPIDFEGEYLSSSSIKSIIGYDFKHQDVKKFVELYSNLKDLVIFDYEKIAKENKEECAGIITYSKKFDLKSGVGIPFIYMDKLVAVLCIEYVEKNIRPSEDELDFLRILGNQIGLAFTQIINYINYKDTAEREIFIRQIIEILRSSLDIVEVKKQIVKELGQFFQADRCFFRAYDVASDKYLAPNIEYLASPDIPSLVGVESDQAGFQFFSDEVKRQKKGFFPIVVDEKFAKGTPLEAYMKTAGIKADCAVPIITRGKELNWLVLHFFSKDPKLSENEKKMLETIAYQIDIAFDQINLYNNAQSTAKRERLLRKIFETIRSSLDINEVKSTIVNQIGKALNADICFILTYNKSSDAFSLDEFSEYKSSFDLDVNVWESLEDERIKWFLDSFRNLKESLFSDINDFISENNLEGEPLAAFLLESKVKSAYHLPILYSNHLLGYIVVVYVKDKKKLSEDELSFLRTIASQAGIAFHQAELYNVMKLQAEREKISKNIIEILRSSLDKNIIKHLFVKNIGKYFNADRVLFVDYDAEAKMYLPVEEGSEYLSSSDVKSFVGYDWSCPQASEYIKPLLEKKELNIFCWEEYIKRNPKSNDFIELFEGSNTRSSYNLPVLYQGQIMGYFCIEFTGDNCVVLSDEDINRIRNMCTQAGIALYHADLYVKAQEISKTQNEYMMKTSEACVLPLKKISELSSDLIERSLNEETKADYIEQIYKLSNELIDKVSSCRQNMNFD